MIEFWDAIEYYVNNRGIIKLTVDKGVEQCRI